MSHAHGATDAVAVGHRAVLVLRASLALAFVAVAVGVVVLWPAHRHFAVPSALSSAGGPVTTQAGRVVAVDSAPCGGPGDTSGEAVPLDEAEQVPAAGSYQCTRAVLAIRSGPDRGRATVLELSPGPGVPALKVGDQVRLARALDATGAALYSFYDFSRGLPLIVLAAVFALVVVGVARWRGLGALLGLLITFVVLVELVLPALLSGEDAVAVAVVGSAVILFPVLYLAHGISLKTSTALLGTLLALSVTAVVGTIATHATHLSGLQEEQNTTVQVYAGKVSVTGLILAGFIIGSLGVLNDITVTQASATFELAAANPATGRRNLYTKSLRIGRDHIASAVYTLVLAYAGSALPVLLLFTISGSPLRDTLTNDEVATELLRGIVGTIGLVLAVPLTTAIAAALATREKMAVADRGRRTAHT
ncbi:MAG TPA: YibE/F family protein [Mycobacteriales bacterium]|nr:YibE/F family protein [Mycobacteriales bacterium]